MSHSTDLGTAFNQILLLTGASTNIATFTSETRTVKFTSDHLGVKNRVMVLHDFNLDYVPSGSDSMRVMYRVDNQTTHGFTITLNPFQYGFMGLAAASSSFVLANSATDSTATELGERDDIYTFNYALSGQGKVVEFTITSSNTVDNHIVGMDIGLTVGDQGRAYLRDGA
jgi:hypothetical protein